MKLARRSIASAVCASLFVLASSVRAEQSDADLRNDPGDSYGLGIGDASSVAWSGQLSSVDPATGVARATLPFELPRARGSAQPGLALVFNSQTGDSDAGVGWSLTTDVIERRGP